MSLTLLHSFRVRTTGARLFIPIFGVGVSASIVDFCGYLLAMLSRLSPQQYASLKLATEWSQMEQSLVACSLSLQQLADLTQALRLASPALHGILITLAAELPAPTVFAPTRKPRRLKWYEVPVYPYS